MKKMQIFFMVVFILLLLVALTFAGCTNSKPPALNLEVNGEEVVEEVEGTENVEKPELVPNTILYQGTASIRITTPEGKVIYIDPFDGGYGAKGYPIKGYDLPADLILVTHNHDDHNKTSVIKERNPNCKTIKWTEALVDGEYRIFDLGYVTVEAVEAYDGSNHNINHCVGYILTLSNGISIYISGDTATTNQMATFAERNLDYAFFCIVEKITMSPEEASACAALVKAKHSLPYHTGWPEIFDRDIAEQFEAKGRIILEPGEELILDGK